MQQSKSVERFLTIKNYFSFDGMLAAVLKDFNNLVLEDVPKPEIKKPNEVIIRVKSCGICATDYKVIRGIRRNVEFPFIPGHEVSGVIEEVGNEVNHVNKGDGVIVQPSGYCGKCRYCRQGLQHYCENAFTTGGDGPKDVRPGGFAEFMKTEDMTIFPKPDSISFDAAALTEPLSGVWKGLIKYSGMSLGDDVVIIGAGSIGLLAIMVASAAGGGHITAVDTSDYALRRAEELGADLIVNPKRCDPVKEIYRVLPTGPDIVVDAAGSIEAVKLMFDLRRRGTRVNLFGITTPERFSLEGGETHFLETRMDSSFGTTPEAMGKAIKLMERGIIDTERIISHRFDLKRINEAMEVMDGNKRSKVMIKP